jgi:hypothetical protein
MPGLSVLQTGIFGGMLESVAIVAGSLPGFPVRGDIEVECKRENKN